VYRPIEELEVYRRACSLGDDLYLVAEKWSRFRQDTIGVQLCRAADSIAANLVEGD
jgi:four helix bundle protein